MFPATALVLYILLALLSYVFAAASHRPTIYLIRHGEKPDDPADDGLNADGFRRAQCLRDVFGAHSGHNIGYVVAPQVSQRGKHRRSYETVLPLAKDLGLRVDTSCKSTQVRCAVRKLKRYRGSGNILIAWRHSQIKKIVRNLGYKDAPEYPDDRFDLIWTIPHPYENITDVRSEACPDLDTPVPLKVQL
ncbi:hypothetical protein BJX96DRAFT_34071 [Aspergillus floccosus]